MPNRIRGLVGATKSCALRLPARSAAPDIRHAVPQRIVCLTEETTETLYLLGEGDRVVGVSGYTVRPPEARAEAAHLGASSRAVRRHRGARAGPDPRLLRSAGRDRRASSSRAATWSSRSTSGRLTRSSQMILHARRDRRPRRPRRATGQPARAPASTGFATTARDWPRRPRVYFEEWDGPLISGIRVGRGARRDRRRHADLSGTARTPGSRRIAS